MALSNKDQQILEHIIKYCNQIALTVQRLKITQESLQKDFLHQNALTMPILQIGELAKKLSPDFVIKYNAVPWQAIRGMRNRFAHVYEETNYTKVWYTAQNDIPFLSNYCTKIIQKNLSIC